jgi:hypothetical protein
MPEYNAMRCEEKTGISKSSAIPGRSQRADVKLRPTRFLGSTAP